MTPEDELREMHELLRSLPKEERDALIADWLREIEHERRVAAGKFRP